MTIALLLLLVGCSTELDAFTEEAPPLACDYATVCGGVLGSDPICEDAIAVTIDDLASDDNCEYRPAQASQCIRELTAQSCDEKTALYYECKRVFRGDGCELDLLDILY